MKTHEDNLLLPATCAKFGTGDILNFLQDKSELFNSLETWFYAQVESEIAVFSKSYFQKMWDEDIMTKELRMFGSLVRSWELFQSLSNLTIMIMVSEIFKIKTFKKDQVILLQSRFSPTNSFFRQYYETRLSKFAETLRAK